MKIKILTAVFVFCMALNGFAQNKKGDDNKPCTRAQLAQLIVDTLPWVKELPDINKGKIKLPDVDAKNPNYQAIMLFHKKFSVDTSWPFRPNEPSTRWQVGLFSNIVVNRIEKFADIKFHTNFNYWEHNPKLEDIPMDPSWAVVPVVSMIEKGVIQGYPDGKFHGKQPATIKEVKLVLQRIKEKTEALLKEKEAQDKPSLEPPTP